MAGILHKISKKNRDQRQSLIEMLNISVSQVFSCLEKKLSFLEIRSSDAKRQ